MRSNPSGLQVDRRRSRRGSTVVEGVFVLLTFLVLVVGIFDIGQALFLHETLVERARNACRYGAVNWDNTDAIRNIVLYGRPTAPDGGGSGIFGLTSSMVTVARANLDSTEERIVVTISRYPFNLVSPWLAGRYQGRTIVASLPTEVP
jgi:hypothetical protein